MFMFSVKHEVHVQIVIITDSLFSAGTKTKIK